DLDPLRPADISSNEDEHDAAHTRAREIREALIADGWPDGILADSGNGAHLLFRVALSSDDGGLVKRCLISLAPRFGDAAVSVDVAVFNPARLVRFYGTVARKGDHTDDRPHRTSRLLHVPADLQTVPLERLESLASRCPHPQAREAASGRSTALSGGF